MLAKVSPASRAFFEKFVTPLLHASAPGKVRAVAPSGDQVVFEKGKSPSSMVVSVVRTIADKKRPKAHASSTSSSRVSLNINGHRLDVRETMKATGLGFTTHTITMSADKYELADIPKPLFAHILNETNSVFEEKGQFAIMNS